MDFTIDFNGDKPFSVDFKGNKPFNVDFNKNSGSASSDYNQLYNKPKINGHQLIGDLTSDDLDIDIPKNTSDLTNDSRFVTEDDIPKNTSDLTNDSRFVTEDDIPKNTSDLINDSEFISRETDPTVPQWAKKPTKPTYTASEVGALPDSTKIPSKTSDLDNDEGFITADDIPPLVTDLGEIDGDLYDWDVEAFLNTLQETGSYVFLWDEFKYWVDIEALEVEGTTTVQQIYWDTEEGGITIYYRNLVIENGEIVRVDTTNFLTFDEANVAFARNAHTHVRFDSKSQSIWDFCNTVAVSNTNPFVIYFDLSTSKTYLIETFVGTRQPVYKLQKVTEMNDTSYFCQRSSYYYSAKEHWGDWYKFSGEVFTPSK